MRHCEPSLSVKLSPSPPVILTPSLLVILTPLPLVILSLSPDERKEPKGKNLAPLRTGPAKGLDPSLAPSLRSGLRLRVTK